jgi:hypothetical protein
MFVKSTFEAGLHQSHNLAGIFEEFCIANFTFLLHLLCRHI